MEQFTNVVAERSGLVLEQVDQVEACASGWDESRLWLCRMAPVLLGSTAAFLESDFSSLPPPPAEVAALVTTTTDGATQTKTAAEAVRDCMAQQGDQYAPCEKEWSALASQAVSLRNAWEGWSPLL